MNEQADDDAVLDEFKQRLKHDWIPAFCNDPKRKGDNLLIDGFKWDSLENLTPTDARDCLLALDSKIVTDEGGCRFTVPRSGAREYIFWEGEKTITPRPFFLWLEPVISFAAMARLHQQYGWPVECLGMQTKKDWKFDIAVFESKQSDHAHILGEVKSSRDQVGTLVDCFQYFSDTREKRDFNTALLALRNSESKLKNLNKPKLENAYKKWLALLERERRPKIFWALGPGRDSRVFEVNSTNGDVILQETGDQKLHCPFKD